MMQIATHGFSHEATVVDNMALEGRRHLLHSNVLGIETVRDELGAVWQECSVPNWDGFDALPVSQDTLRNTYRFLEALPLGVPPSSIGGDPDGALTVEWYHSPRHLVSVSVDADGDLHYAAMIGPNKQFGTEVFTGDISPRILRLINEVCCR